MAHAERAPQGNGPHRTSASRGARNDPAGLLPLPHADGLAEPAVGIEDETHCRGEANAQGEFQDEDGDRVAFLPGSTSLGTAEAAAHVNLTQIVSVVGVA